MTSMGPRFSCNELRVKNTMSCSAKTDLASEAGNTGAAETLTLTETDLAENLMFLYALRAPDTVAVPTQTVTLNLPASNFLATLNVYQTHSSQDAGQGAAEQVSVRRVSGSEYVITRTTADASNIAHTSFIEIMLMTYD